MTSLPRPGVDSRWVAWLAFVAIVLHVAVFLPKAVNPLVISDAWYFVDSFLRKYVEGHLTLGDFFTKRTAVDHSLPFHKLLLLANYRLFGLDLAMDAWLGFGFAVAGTVLFRHAIRRSTGEAFATWPVQLVWVAILAAYLSLNASHIFEWPMLTLSFVTMFANYCLFVACHRAVVNKRWMLVVPLVFFVLVALDNGGVIVVLAAMLASVLLALRLGLARRGLAIAALLAASIVAYKLGYLVLAPPVQTTTPATAGLASVLGDPGQLVQLARSLTVPLTAAVLHPMHASMLFGGAAKFVQVVLAIAMVTAHAWFWWQVLKRRPTVAWHLAIALMLVFYGLCAGVLIGRVPHFGGAVFEQPRYVVFYQLHVVALLLMAATWFGERKLMPDGLVPRVIASALVAACVMVLGLQVPLSREAWKRAPYARRYVERVAAQMDALAAAPADVPAGCLPLLTVCRMAPDMRVRAVTFLHDRRLNLFSDDFRRRHGFAEVAD